MADPHAVIEAQLLHTTIYEVLSRQGLIGQLSWSMIAYPW